MDLKPGESICDKCNGTGIDKNSIYVVRLPNSFYVPYEPPHVVKTICWLKCNKCLGEGKVDWIENIIRKRKPEFYIDSHLMRSTKKPIYPNDGDMYYNMSKKIVYLYAVNKWIKINEGI